MSVDQVRLGVGGLMVGGAPALEFSGVSTDSRTTKPGDLFVALVGDRFDGHDFIPQAFARGAAGALFSRDFEPDKDASRKILLKVADTLTALGELAIAYRKTLSAAVVGITGSNGKTTTKDMTRHVLAAHFPTVASPASFNNFIGLPLTLFDADDATRVVVLEMGTNHPGEIARLAQIAAPDVAVVTNVGRTHLEGLKTIQGVAAAKAEIFSALRPGGAAILNADDPLVAAMNPPASAKVSTFGLRAEADVRAGAVECSDAGIEFTINDSVRACLKVPGLHNVYNALAAAAVCLELGLDLPEIALRLSDYRLPPMRLEEKCVLGAIVINDAYNANPESMSSAIAELARRKGRRKFLVFADMLELGESAKSLHGEMGELAARAGFDFYWAAGDLARIAIDAVVDAGVPAGRARFFTNMEDLGGCLNAQLRPGDVVLIKASRAMGLERVLDLLH